MRSEGKTLQAKHRVVADAWKPGSNLVREKQTARNGSREVKEDIVVGAKGAEVEADQASPEGSGPWKSFTANATFSLKYVL